MKTWRYKQKKTCTSKFWKVLECHIYLFFILHFTATQTIHCITGGVCNMTKCQKFNGILYFCKILHVSSNLRGSPEHHKHPTSTKIFFIYELILFQNAALYLVVCNYRSCWSPNNMLMNSIRSERAQVFKAPDSFYVSISQTGESFYVPKIGSNLWSSRAFSPLFPLALRHVNEHERETLINISN